MLPLDHTQVCHSSNHFFLIMDMLCKLHLLSCTMNCHLVLYWLYSDAFVSPTMGEHSSWPFSIVLNLQCSAVFYLVLPSLYLPLKHNIFNGKCSTDDFSRETWTFWDNDLVLYPHEIQYCLNFSPHPPFSSLILFLLCFLHSLMM